MIIKCEVQNFKGFTNKTVLFNPFSVVVGQNNIGKSSILHAILLGHEIIKRGITITRRGYELKNTTLTLDDLKIIPLSTVDSIWLNNKFTQTNEAKIKLYYTETSWIEVSMTRGKNRNVSIIFQQENITDELLVDLVNELAPFALLVPGLAGIPSKEAYVGKYSRTKSITVGDANLVLRNVVASLGTNDEKKFDFERLQSILKKMFPELKRIKTEYDEKINEFLIVEYEREDSTELFDIVTAGTGFLQSLQILSYIFEYKPKVLLLDEPDSHLHANNQVLLIEELRSLSREMGFQIIISTHSREILQGTPPNSIVWVNSGYTATPGVDEGTLVQAYIDLGGLDKLDKIRLNQHAATLLVEDEDLTVWNKLFAKRLGDDWESFVLISTFKGKSNRVALFLTSEFYRKHFATRRVGFVIDHDYDSETKLQEYSDEANRQQIQPHILKAHEIENYFITPDVIQRALLSSGVRLEIDEVREIINIAIQETITDHKYKLMDKLQIEDRRITPSYADSKAHEIIEEKLKDLDEAISWLRGKPILRRIRSLVQEKYAKNLPDSILIDSLYETNNPEILSIFNWVKVIEPEAVTAN